MGIGIGILLLVLGAIFYFAVNVQIAGLDIATVGVILMAAGALDLIITLIVLNRRRTARVVTAHDPVAGVSERRIDSTY